MIGGKRDMTSAPLLDVTLLLKTVKRTRVMTMVRVIVEAHAEVFKPFHFAEAAWEIISVCTWLVHFTEKLLRACVVWSSAINDASSGESVRL